MRRFLPRHRTNSGRKREQGIIITLVAIFMLFAMGAMAALSIDVVTLYTARSEAQIAADSAALAAARVLANSGMTSSTSTSANPFPIAATETLATNVATQVAQQNPVGGRALVAANGEVVVSYSNDSLPLNNPRVTVHVKRTDLPTFFARIWGSTTITVAASATAETYNPQGLANGTAASQSSPVATTCVKPWLLPNIDPTSTTTSIFNPTTGAITNPNLLGLSPPGLTVDCTNGDCSTSKNLLTPTAWKYYPGDTSSTGSFPAPDSASVVCSPPASGFTATTYQLSVAGCVQTPLSCSATSVSLDLTDYSSRDAETFAAVNCLTHASASLGDGVNANPTPPPFQFLAGADNPLVQASILNSGSNVLVSDSLVTVPVYDCAPNSSCTASPAGSVNVIGFVQLFLNPDGNSAPGGPLGAPLINTTVINMVGCGSGASGPAVRGNGASAVAVRLITPP